MNAIMKQSPLYGSARDLGAEFSDHGGWELPERFSPVEDELRAAREGVAVMDVSGNGKIMVEGQGLDSLFPAGWQASGLRIHEGTYMGEHTIYRLRADRFFVSTPPGKESQVVEVLSESQKQAESLITITDFTHGRAEIRIVGPKSPDLLARLCGLDFYDDAFPNLQAKQSSVAKTAQLILRSDIDTLRAYSLIGDRSLAAYLWETIMDAGEDLSLIPIGMEAFREL